MSNYSSDYEKTMNRIEVLEMRDKELDKTINQLYSNYAPDEEINALKSQRLQVEYELSNLKQWAEENYEA
jgi:uncharacterized protein YdcH (DUF465 family)